MRASEKRRIEDNRQGRRAQTPHQIPRRGWIAIVRRVIDRISNENLSIVSAGIGFFSLLAIFPLLIATVSIYGLLADPAMVEQHIGAVFGLIPRDAATVFRDQLHQIVQSSPKTLGWRAIVSFVVAIYASMEGVKALISGMNIVYNEREKRSFLRLNAVALAFSLGAILFVIFALGLIAVVPVILNILGFGQTSVVIAELIRWPLLAVAIISSLVVLNRYAPSRDEPKWRWVTWGTIISAIVWLLISVGFSYYVNNFGNYNKTYGSLTGALVLLMWFYITCYVILIGATFNAESEHQTERDTTIGKPQPMGKRGANKADTVPKPR